MMLRSSRNRRLQASTCLPTSTNVPTRSIRWIDRSSISVKRAVKHCANVGGSFPPPLFKTNSLILEDSRTLANFLEANAIDYLSHSQLHQVMSRRVPITFVTWSVSGYIVLCKNTGCPHAVIASSDAA